MQTDPFHPADLGGGVRVHTDRSLRRPVIRTHSDFLLSAVVVVVKGKMLICYFIFPVCFFYLHGAKHISGQFPIFFTPHAIDRW